MQSGPLGIAPGTIVAGQYRIESAIGEGGYGAVYAATQLNLGRRVALKVLHPDVITRATALQRFRREAELAQGLAHPNTVRLFDFGEAFGRPFIVYEFLDGRSLEATLAVEGRLPPPRVARVASQTLKALMEAHAKGIVHRDIKPGNLFICNFAGEPDYVKVLDFGIASARSNATGQALTQEGTTLGTPAYMAPEQALAQDLDGRADLYSVGLVMAEALSGRRVFGGNTAMEILIAQASDAPVPLPPEVTSSPLANVIARATRKPREQRFASARDMLEALESLTTGSAASHASWRPSTGHVVVTPSGGLMGAGERSQLQQAPTTSVPITGGGSGQPPQWTAPSGPPPMGLSQPYASAQSPHAAVPVAAPNPHGPTAFAVAPAAPHGSTLSGSFVAGGGRAKPKSSTGLVIFAVLGVAFLVLAGVGGWLFYTYNAALERARTARAHPEKHRADTTDPTRDSDDDSTELHAPPKLPRPAPTPSLKGFVVHGKSAQDVLDRMVELKWRYLSGSEMDIGFGLQSTYTFEGGGDSVAQLKLYRASNTPGFGGFTLPGAKTVRDGPWVAELMVFSTDGDIMDAPMEEIFPDK